MISNDELVEFFDASATTYRFLSQVMFKELNEEAIAALSAQEWPEDTGNANLDSGYALMRRYFAFAAHDARTQLACEYARVFFSSGRVYQESPHGRSVRVGFHQRRAYRDAGFSR